MSNIGIFIHPDERAGIHIQAKNWKKVLEKLGNRVFLFSQADLPEVSISYPIIKHIYKNSFIKLKDYTETDLLCTIEHISEKIKRKITLFIEKNQIDTLILENILSSGLNIPYGVALGNMVNMINMTIAHHHTFWWEVSGVGPTCKGIKELIEKYFPMIDPHITHVTVNSIAQATFRRRKGIYPRIVPYMCDLDCIVSKNEREKADVLSFFYPYHKDDEGLKVALEISKKLVKNGFLRRIDKRDISLFTDAPSSSIDFVLYIKSYEPWGDYLLESVKFRLPILISPYKVYKRDISHFGFDFLIFKDIDNAVKEIEDLLLDRGRIERMVEHNFSILERCFSLDMLKDYIRSISMGKADVRGTS